MEEENKEALHMVVSMFFFIIEVVCFMPVIFRIVRTQYVSHLLIIGCISLTIHIIISIILRKFYP